ncbi:MAG: 50S ribosomal protein L25 [Candidatus Tectomicrobia bacterium]
METMRLVAHKRQEAGKGVARRLRRAGKLPAVLYGHGESEAIAVDSIALLLIRQSGTGANTIIDLVIGDDNPQTCSVILRELQVDPISRAQVHADFYRVAMDEPITVTVPLAFVNEPEDRLNAAQAVLSHLLHDVEVRCLPRDIPETIRVDLQALDIGVVLNAGGLELPQGVTLVTSADEPVVTTTVTAAAEEVPAAEER